MFDVILLTYGLHHPASRGVCLAKEGSVWQHKDHDGGILYDFIICKNICTECLIHFHILCCTEKSRVQQAEGCIRILSIAGLGAEMILLSSALVIFQMGVWEQFLIQYVTEIIYFSVGGGKWGVDNCEISYDIISPIPDKHWLGMLCINILILVFECKFKANFLLFITATS